MLWGIGPKAKERLRSAKVSTIGALAQLQANQLQSLFGERGPELAARAQGIDNRPVAVSHERRSISSERTFRTDIGDEIALRRVMLGMSEQLGRRLRKEGLAGSTVRIKLRWPDFQTITRQSRLDQPTNQDMEIFHAAWELFQASWKVGKKVRLLGVAVSDLGDQVRQLDLFDQSWAHDDRLMEAIDKIRSKFGKHALRRASSLNKEERGKQ
jgi:DNA polymerase-4